MKNGGDKLDPLLKEYGSWHKENEEFYRELEEHDSVLYDRFLPVYEVLNYLYGEITGNNLEETDDLNKIFGVGLEYINDQFQTCKLYLDKYFQNDLHVFLAYDRVVNALLYLEDVRYELEENGLDANNEKIDLLIEELEAMLEDKKPVETTFSLYVDDALHDAIGEKISSFVGIIDIFVEVAETLGLQLYEENEIVIGKNLEGD